MGEIENYRIMKESSKFPIIVQVLGLVQMFVVLGLIYNQTTDKPDVVLAVSVGILLLVTFFRVRLKIDDEGIHVRTLLFIKKTYLWSEIEKVNIGKLYAVKHFGGWGLRLSKIHGIGYISGTDHAIYIQLYNGKKRAISVKNDSLAEKVIIQQRKKEENLVQS